MGVGIVFGTNNVTVLQCRSSLAPEENGLMWAVGQSGPDEKQAIFWFRESVYLPLVR